MKSWCAFKLEIWGGKKEQKLYKPAKDILFKDILKITNI